MVNAFVDAMLREFWCVFEWIYDSVHEMCMCV